VHELLLPPVTVLGLHTRDETPGCVTPAAVKPREKFREFPPKLAVSVAEPLALTAAGALAVKTALLAPDAMVTEGGTVADGLLLLSEMIVELVTAEVRLTVHDAVAGGVKLAGEQVRLESVGVAVALFKVSVKFLEMPLRLAVSRAEVVALTADGLAVNRALLTPAKTVTEGGTLTDALPLVSATLVELVAAPLRFTVQDDVAGGVRLAGVQVRLDSDTVLTGWLMVMVVPVPVVLMALPLASEATRPDREIRDEVLVVPAAI